MVVVLVVVGVRVGSEGSAVSVESRTPFNWAFISILAVCQNSTGFIGTVQPAALPDTPDDVVRSVGGMTAGAGGASSVAGAHGED